MTRFTQVQSAVASLLEELGVDLKDPNYVDTPKRVAEYFLEHYRTKRAVREEIAEIATAVFPSEYEGIVQVSGATIWSMCPHHLLPVEYKVTVAYIPSGQTIGLSKLVRIPKIICAEPALQEDSTLRIANVLSDVLGTEDVAVVLQGRHLCMACRGVEEINAVTSTSEMRGAFFTEGSARNEFFQLAKI